jgi:outer membrane protein OmpA-like peptidoglycan-associated protein
LGSLDQPIATVDTDAQGRFNLALQGLRVGERISAIATHPVYGSSEPSDSAVIASLEPNQAPSPTPQSPTSLPRCTTPVAERPPVPTPPPPATIRLTVPQAIHFALDRDTISPASAQVLDRIVRVLQDNPFIVVELVGHTDPRASDAYNLDLGRRRALSVRNYLLRRGVAAARMTLRSQGERSPLSQGTTRLDYARDRRVEFLYKDIRDIEVIVQEEDLQLEPSGGQR